MVTTTLIAPLPSLPDTELTEVLESASACSRTFCRNIFTLRKIVDNGRKRFLNETKLI